MIAAERDVTHVIDLVARLAAAGATVPPEIVAAAAQRSTIDEMFRTGYPTVPTVMGLTSAQVPEVLIDLATQYTHDPGGSAGPMAQARSALGRAFDNAIADALAAAADTFLDQLRSSFTAAAAAVHDAAALGINATTTDTSIVTAETNDITALIEAWTGLSDHVVVLEEISSLRVALTTKCGAPPQVIRTFTEDPTPSDDVLFGAMFAPNGGLPWRIDRWEQPWQRWLRLCTHAPAQLLSTTEGQASISTRRGR